MPSFIEIDPIVLEKIFFVKVLSRLFRKYLPLEKSGGWASFEQTLVLITQGCFVPSLVEIGLVVLEKRIFKFRQGIFAIS